MNLSNIFICKRYISYKMYHKKINGKVKCKTSNFPKEIIINNKGSNQMRKLNTLFMSD